MLRHGLGVAVVVKQVSMVLKCGGCNQAVHTASHNDAVRAAASANVDRITKGGLVGIEVLEVLKSARDFMVLIVEADALGSPH